ncbi:glycoside hydrolase family 2 protein [Lederbergia sp. NSJ-179]|uniref:beta-mannosidase n=1 Tax=Lederbergia sp. NSJ-179 TaxID=2931402 RepID=UPI001FD16161|nr:glycoside hydrolase family 2 protein [Lederbergia sp. NSJ-179]MCJ7839866.1 glycoside hydrolase family 2 protein [Lederbergia sp. NSJ-179]
MQLLDLSGKWEMKRKDESEWIEATVPGSVFKDLLDARKMADPFFRDNEYEAFELSKYDYEYKRSFVLNEESLQRDKAILRCEGLDTLCDVFVNGSCVLNGENMHRTYEVDIKESLVIGENHIYILIKSATNFIEEKDRELFNEEIPDDKPGITHLRKALCMFGWDWGPKLGDMGIWRKISIVGYDEARIDDVYISQTHLDNKVHLDVRVGVQKWCETRLGILVTVVAPDEEQFQKRINTENIEELVNMEINNPKLWWPNNLGKQYLYQVKVELLHDEQVLDVHSCRIGLRTITLKQEKDQWGQSFGFEVNGKSIFSMGADYIPEDSVIGRRHYDKTKKLIESCAKANYNMIRVWGGGYYPDDYFFDLCDEYGLIVWQDHLYACKAYEFNDAFKENIKQETIDNVKRIRNHACLGLWCGNNEMEILWANWGWGKRYGSKMQADYLKHFEVFLPELTKSLDPNTSYWVSSPSSTGFFNDPDNENFGDMHYWDVWHGRKPLTEYRKIYPRFNSEFGIQSFPSLKTIETFTLPEDRNIFSRVMESHQKDGTGNEKILHYVGDNFKYPKNFDSLLYASQLVQAEGMRYGVEHWRRNRGRCLGALIWQLNDCWPVASWASMDYFNRWKATQYMARRFYSPILASACEEGTKIELHVSNDTLHKVDGKLSWKLLKRNAEVLKEDALAVSVEQLSTKKMIELDFADVIDKNNKQSVYFSYQLEVDGRVISEGTTLFVKAKHFDFQDPEIMTEIYESEDAFTIEVSCNSFAKFVELDLTNNDAIFSDNIFDLTAGAEKKVAIKKENLSSPLTLEELKKQLKVRSLFDTFE